MKPNLLIVISLPRSGTNYFLDKIQKIESKNIHCYYELFNDSFYGKSECWDNFYDKYKCKNKLEVLDKLLDYGNGLHEFLQEEKNNHEDTLTIIKIFPNQISKKEFIKIIENKKYKIQIVFLIRNIKDVHQSYYHALTNNDWTRNREKKLEHNELEIMLENEDFNHVFKNKIFECYLNDMLNIIKHYNKDYQLLNFNNYKDFQIKDFEKLILILDKNKK